MAREIGQMRESWRLIDGYPEHWVSNLGRVWSCKGVTHKEIKPFRVGQYLGVQLALRAKKIYVHRLVAKHLVGEEQFGLQVNHKNGNKHDNRAENLEWVTRRGNMLHRTHVLGLRAGQFGPGRTRIGGHA